MVENRTIDAKNQAKLFEYASKGDNNAFDLIYEEYFSPIYKYLFVQTRTKQDAEDLTQKVFLRAFIRIKKTGKPQIRNPKHFFFRIAKNLLIDYWRKRKESFLDEEIDIKDEGLDIEDDISGKEEVILLRKNVNKLKFKQRQIIILRYICDLSYGEISKLLKTNEAALRQNHSRALKSLKKIYE